MKLIWHESAWHDYLEWQATDKKKLKRINQLIRDISRNGYNATGKPESLSGNLSGFWSVRINKKNRIVLLIIRLKSHNVKHIIKNTEKNMPDVKKDRRLSYLF